MRLSGRERLLMSSARSPNGHDQRFMLSIHPFTHSHIHPFTHVYCRRYSHSIVAGGFELMSYTTRLMPRTELTMRLEITASRSCGRRAQSAVMPSRLSTARIATVNSYVRSSPMTPTLCTGRSTANDCHSRRYHPALRI